MKVQSISATTRFNRAKNLSSANEVKNVQNLKLVQNAGLALTFRGGNPDQIVSIATESTYLGGTYAKGGLANVVDEAAEAMSTRPKTSGSGAKDIRTFLPYYTYKDKEKSGGIWVKKAGTDGSLLTDYMLKDANYSLADGETYSLITDVRNGKVKSFDLQELTSGTTKRMRHDSKLELTDSPYKVFKIVQERSGGGVKPARQDAHYIVHTHELARGESAYGHAQNYEADISRVKALAKKATMDGSSGAGGKHDISKDELRAFNANEIFYKDFTSAILDSKKKIQEVEKFKPQVWWLHDRFSYPMIPDIIQRAKAGDADLQGLRVYGMLHNVGRGYQGVYENPLEFFKLIATEKDFEELKARKDFPLIQQLSDMMQTKEGVSGKNAQLLDSVFDSRYGNYKDDYGFYNMSKIIVSHTEEDPVHFSYGTVSRTFGREMANPETKDIAEGLTYSLQRTEKLANNVTNGSRPSSMKTNVLGDFGKGKLTDIFANPDNPNHYVPYENKLSDVPDVRAAQIEAAFNAKQVNKKNLINILAEASEKLGTPDGKDALADLFMDAEKKAGYRKYYSDLELTLGKMSPYQEGDILMLGWGRPDPQKGMPISIEGFKEFLMNEDIPLETRLKTKLVLGAGVNGFPGNFQDPYNIVKKSRGGVNKEWEYIRTQMQEIADYAPNGGKKGAFEGNCIYVNGFFPNRLITCSDVGDFTSRFEPCGITPLESYATGTPVISTNTGGAGDFVKSIPVDYDASVKSIKAGTITNETGVLTKTPYMLNADYFKSSNLPPVSDPGYAEALDKARSTNIAKQIGKAIYGFIQAITNPDNKKKLVENALSQEIEWDKNREYNGGLSAIQSHFGYSFAMQKELETLPADAKSSAKYAQTLDCVKQMDNAYKYTVNSLGNNIEKLASEEVVPAKTDKVDGKGFLNFLKQHKTASIVVAGVAFAGGLYYWYSQKKSVNQNKPAETNNKAAALNINKAISKPIVLNNKNAGKSLALNKFA